MQIFCYIPPVCLADGDISAQVRKQLHSALALGLPPAPPPRGTTGRAVRLDDDSMAAITPMATELGLAPGRVVGGLLYALHLNAGMRSPGTGHAVIAPVLTNLRPGQIRCLEEAAPLLKTGKIIASECGTGSGKSRIIAHAAAHVLAMRNRGCPPPVPPLLSTDGVDAMPAFIHAFALQAQTALEQRLAMRGQRAPQTVLISAPSVENVSHLIREWVHVRAALEVEKPIRTALVFGRGQFVSPSSLERLLAESEESYPEIQAWLDRGMPCGQIPSTAFLRQIEPRLCGLMIDLEALALKSGLVYADACLDEDSPDEEQTLYRALREDAFHSDIVWTTHAMLCMDSLRLTDTTSAPLLPPPLALFVDEAHLLEQIQASVAAKSLSFTRLFSVLRDPKWGAMRKAAPASKALASARTLVERLIELPNETPLPISRTGDLKLMKVWNEAVPLMRTLQQELSGLVKGLNSDKQAQSRAEYGKLMRYVEKGVRALEQIGKDFHGHVEHTPKRGCISFNVGPSSVDRYLAARWATTPTAMLLSGTLHYIGAQGVNYGAIYSEMSIPVSRRAATIPMHPGWLTETPVVLTPSPKIFHRFVPPTGDDINDLSLAAWLSECAKVVNLAAKDAAGGMLVLMTGYDRLEGLVQALQEHFPRLKERLIYQTRHSRLTSNIPVFKAMARAGQRPIWIATGSAWTGLDLADELVDDSHARDDILLTDLVIPNLPFGLQRTTTHVNRVSRLGFGVESLAAQRLFRQGLGRGMRRDGVERRRYWVIDGRLQHPVAASYTADLRRILSGFIHREAFVV